jgi:hypothetical protein
MIRKPEKIAARLRKKEMAERAARQREEPAPRLYSGTGDIIRNPRDAGMKQPTPKRRRN